MDEATTVFDIPSLSFNIISWNTKGLCMFKDISQKERSIFIKSLLFNHFNPHLIALQEMPTSSSIKKIPELIQLLLNEINSVCQSILNYTTYTLIYLSLNENVFLIRSDLKYTLCTDNNQFQIQDKIKEMNSDPITISILFTHTNSTDNCNSDTNNQQEYIITSAHFPFTHVRARVNAIRQLLSTYSSHSLTQWNRPFDAKGAKDARKALPIHIICGDFNEEMDNLKALVQREVCMRVCIAILYCFIHTYVCVYTYDSIYVCVDI